MLNNQVMEFRTNTPEWPRRPDIGARAIEFKLHWAAVRRTELHTILQRPIRERLPLAVEHVGRFTDSYSRMAEVLAFKDRLTRPDWLHLLGEFWEVCDNVADHGLELRKMLGTDGPLRAMMKPQQNAAYDALPEKVTIYRGCGELNMMGMSWSLDKEVANSFPYIYRYKVPNPLLVTSTVTKRKILAVKLARDEDEVITFSARSILKESCAEPSPEWRSKRAAEQWARIEASCAHGERI
jgi:hypothetical protein